MVSFDLSKIRPVALQLSIYFNEITEKCSCNLGIRIVQLIYLCNWRTIGPIKSMILLNFIKQFLEPSILYCQWNVIRISNIYLFPMLGRLGISLSKLVFLWLFREIILIDCLQIQKVETYYFFSNLVILRYIYWVFILQFYKYFQITQKG